MPHLVILDGHTLNPGDLDWSPISTLADGFTVHERTLDRADILPRIGDCELALTNKTPLKRETLQAAPRLRYVGILATGSDNVDVEAARELGISVTNVPRYGTMAVAQYAIGLLLEICGHVGLHSEAIRRGRWKSAPDWCFWDRPLIELEGKVMGIVGYGAIGRAVAGIARALGMRVIAYNGDRPPRTEESARNDPLVNFTELLAVSDVISLHAPLRPENRDIINRASISGMKDGVIIINTARGGLVVEKDLDDALKSGKVYAAGLDVMKSEPPDESNPLVSEPNCFITPHIAWAPIETRARLIHEAAANLRCFLAGTPRNLL
ncbi:MAG: D-2-hydroxyacid dehydrogenase [Deltaproteobacteria bacterium]|jgi:glycerate dehydrogenase|nr:D-2-hydroxyacid dehydrogenase [Deltaproteobacteria bacterium]